MSPANGSSSSSTRRLLIWIGSIVGVLAVLVIVAALVVPRLFTSEELKGYVIPPLEEATGRQVEIDAIELRVLPFPAVRVSGFQLANAEGYGPEPAVEARALYVDLALWPLFAGNVRPSAIGLVNPVVRYEVNEQGASNFDDLGGAPDTTGGPPLAGIPVSDFRTTSARLHYVDRSSGQRLRANFDARLNALPDGSAVTSQGRVDLRSLRAVLPDVGPDTLSLRDATARYDVRVAPDEGRVDVRGFRLETAPLTLAGKGTLSQLNTRPVVDLQFETGETDLGQIAAFLPAAAVEGLDPQGTLELRGSVSGSLPDTTGRLDDLSVDATGRLAGVGVDYQGRNLLRDTNADLRLSMNAVSLKSIQGQLLGASMSGNAEVHQLGADPQVGLYLKTGRMNLADLAAFAPADQAGSYNPSGTLRLEVSATGPLPTSLDSLEGVTIDGSGRLAGVGADYEGRAMIRDLGADLVFSGSSASMQSIDGRLFGEPISGQVTVQDLTGEPQIEGRLAGGADLAQLAVLTSDEKEAAPSVQGSAEYDVEFSGPVDTPEAIRPTGRVSLSEVQYPYESFRRPLEIPKATLELTGTGLSTDRVTVRSGEQTMTLQATLQNLFPISKGLDETNPAMNADFTFTADRLDLGELYTEPDTADVYYSQLVAANLAGVRVRGKSPEALAEQIYGEVDLPGFGATGRVEIGTLINEPQRYDSLAFDVRLEDRRLALENLTGSTYDGSFGGTITLSQRGTQAADTSSTTLAYDLTLTDARASGFARDWTTLGRFVDGVLDLQIQGETPMSGGLLPVPDALTATGQSTVTSGGFSLDLGVAQVLVDRLGISALPVKKFRQFGGPFAIQDGQIELDTWTLGDQAISAQLTGAVGLGGSVNLTMRMDLPLRMVQGSKIPGLVGGGDGALARVIKKLTGGDAADATVPLEVQIGGTMREPTVEILNQNAVRGAIEKIAKGAGLDLLRGIFEGGGG